MLMSTISGKSQKGWKTWKGGVGLRMGVLLPQSTQSILEAWTPPICDHEPHPLIPSHAHPQISLTLLLPNPTSFYW